MRAAGPLTAAFVALLACEQAQDRTAANVVERMIEKKGREARVEIDREDGSITVHLGDAIVPKEWPADVPVPPRARRLRVDSSPRGGKSLSVSAESGRRELEAWYRDALVREGWRVEPGGDGEIRATRTGQRLAATFTRSDDRARGRIEVEPDGERGG